VRGIDVDPAAVACARRALALYAEDDRAGESVVLGDALDDRGLATVAGVHSLDAVLGNPPWLREKDARATLERARASALGERFGAPRMDLWYLFAHAALEALGPGGRHGFVVPGYWLDAASAARLRAHVSAEARLETLLDLGSARVFPDVSGRCVAYVLEKGRGRRPVERIVVSGRVDSRVERSLESGSSHPEIRRERVSIESLVCADGRIGSTSRGLRAIAGELEASGHARDWIVSEGVTPGPDRWTHGVARRAALAEGSNVEALERALGIRRGEGVFVVPRAFLERDELTAFERSLVLPFALPREIARFAAPALPAQTILYLTRATLPRKGDAPALVRHLERFRPALDRRRETLRGTRRFFELHWPRDPALFSGPRVLVPRMVRAPLASFVEEQLVVGESVLVLVPPDRSLARAAAALLNTAPAAAWLLARGKRRGVGIDVSVALLRGFPWPRAMVEGARLPVAHADECAVRRAAGDPARSIALATALVACSVDDPAAAPLADVAAAQAWGLDPARVRAALDEEGGSR
jgi:adenine-specific DNA-methyltransferase